MRHPLGDKWLLLILGVASVLDIWGIWWGLPNTASWAVDSSVPMTTLRGALCQFSHGWHGQHQPLQPALIALLCVPLFAHVYLTGGIDLTQVQRTYPWGLRDPEAVLSGVIIVGRLLSVFSHLLLVWAMYRTGLRLGGRATGLAAAALSAFYYPFVYYAHAGNPDMLYMALLGVGMLSLLVFLGKPSARTITSLSCFAALSTSVKFQALPFFAGMVPVVLWWLFMGEQPGRRLTTQRATSGAALAGLGLVVFVATFAVANNWMFNFEKSVRWIQSKKAGAERSIEVRAERARMAETLYAADASTKRSFAQDTWHNMRESCGLPVLVMAVGGLVFCVVKSPLMIQAFIPPLVTCAVFYWKVHADYPRYLFPMVLPVLLLAAVGLDVARGWCSSRPWSRRLLTITAIAILTVTFMRSAAMSHLLLTGSRYQAERWLAERPQFRESTVVLYQDPHKAPRLERLARVVSLGPDSYFARQKAERDVRGNFVRPRVPDHVTSLSALLRLNPDLIVLLPTEEPDNKLAYQLQRHSDRYAIVAKFGGPTPLLRLTFSANPPLYLYRRVIGAPGS